MKWFNMQTFIGFVIVTIFTSSCQIPKEKKIKPVKDPFFGMAPTNIPQLLEPDFLATNLEEYNGTFSPDGKEFYYTTDTPGKGFICYSKLKPDNTWSKPVIAHFSGKYSEYDPLFSPDGKRLYFSSQRPTPDKPKNTKSSIWFLERTENGWSEPKFIKLTGKGDYYSSITKNGDIYFNVWSNGFAYKATKSDTSYVVEKLSKVINGGSDIGDPFISPDEDYLIFRGYKNSLGRGDLYISFNINREWTEPENLGAPINSTAHEMGPYVTPDGKFLIFSSARKIEEYTANPNEPLDELVFKGKTYDNGVLNIYYVSTDFIDKLKAKYLKE